VGDSTASTEATATTATGGGGSEATATTTGGAAPPAPADATGSSTPAGAAQPPAAGPSGPGPGCVEGTYAVVAAFDLGNGAHQWSSCDAEPGYRTVLATTDAVVLVALETPAPATTLVAVDAGSGADLWRAPATRPRWGWPEGAYAGSDTVVFRTGDAAGAPAVVAVDALTGVERWRLPGPEVGEPVANTEAVAVLAEATRLRGVDRLTGGELWTLEVVYQDLSGVAPSRAGTAVDGEAVVAPTTSGLVSFSALTGRERWRSQLYGAPTAASRTLVATTSTAGTFVALDAPTGIERFRATGGPSDGDRWAVGDGAVHVVDPEAGLVAYDLTTGAVRWSRILGSDLFGQPRLVFGGRVIMLSEAQMALVSTANGTTWWLRDRPLDNTWMSSVGANTASVIVAADTLAPAA
jgi:outer membrane protein assembly factor BamB